MLAPTLEALTLPLLAPGGPVLHVLGLSINSHMQPQSVPARI